MFVGTSGNVALNEHVVVKFPVSARRVKEESPVAFEREILFKIKVAEKNLLEELEHHVTNKIAKSVNDAISFYKVASVEDLSAYNKRALACAQKRTEEFKKNVEEVLSSLVFVSHREVIYRNVPYIRYEEVKNLTLNHLEALEERMRDFEYNPALFQAYDVYVNHVRAFLKLVRFS